jgi:hypothetical protein
MPEKDNRQRGTEEFREHGWRKASTAVLLTRLLILVVLMVGAFVLAHGCSLFTPSSPAAAIGGLGAMNAWATTEYCRTHRRTRVT